LNSQHGKFIGFSLDKVYEIAAGYIAAFFPNDKVLQELLAIDYHLQHKIKPASRFVEEVDKKEKFSLLESLKLPHNKFRYTVLNISFDHQQFIKDNSIRASNEILIIEFTGTEKPYIIHSIAQGMTA